MPRTAQMSRYYAFGLQIRSDLALPELLPGKSDQTPDIEIMYGDLAEEWAASEPQASFFRLTAEGVMFAVPRMAIYRIKDGRSIVIHPLEDADEKWIRLYLLGSCMGALLMQRRILPLHGSAVVIDGRAYCFLGESGAGKSTLAALLARRGYALLSDDVIPVALGPDGRGGQAAYVTPSYPQQKLWQESLDGLGMTADGYQPLLSDVSKFAVPSSVAYSGEPVRIQGLFELAPGEDAEQIEIRAVHKLERLLLIGQHTYRSYLVPLLGIGDWHFQITAGLAGGTNVFNVRRPLAPFSAEELADRIIHTIREEIEAV